MVELKRKSINRDLATMLLTMTIIQLPLVLLFWRSLCAQGIRFAVVYNYANEVDLCV